MNKIVKSGMFLLDKMLTKVGVGTLQLNTRMERITLHACDTLRGDLFIYGGRVSQRIDKLTISLMVTLRSEHGEESSTLLQNYLIAENVVTEAGRNRIVRFSFVLPPDVPPTNPPHCIVWLHTEAHLRLAVNPIDYDEIQILPNELLQAIEVAFFTLDFKLVHRKNTRPKPEMNPNLPLVEEISLRNLGHLKYYVESIELVMIPHLDLVEVFVEINRYKNRSRYKKTHFTIFAKDAQNNEDLAHLIEKKLLEATK
jgi:sporulation-control protein